MSFVKRLASEMTSREEALNCDTTVFCLISPDFGHIRVRHEVDLLFTNRWGLSFCITKLNLGTYKPPTYITFNCLIFTNNRLQPELVFLGTHKVRTRIAQWTIWLKVFPFLPLYLGVVHCLEKWAVIALKSCSYRKFSFATLREMPLIHYVTRQKLKAVG